MDAEEPDRTEANETIESVAPMPGDGARGGGSRRRPVRLLLLGLPIVFVLLVAWNRAAASDEFCATCHSMQPASLTAARSVHEDVPCIECHSGAGVSGSVRYLPTLAREALATISGWGVADGVLPARSCESCHGNLDAAAMAPAHEDTRASCESCHGDVSHPVFTTPGADYTARPGENPHVPRYTQTHGVEATDAPGSCVDCHEARFCQACHFRETFPHPDDWIGIHGEKQREQGPDACVLCHASTFCSGCHGTEIPHVAGWLGEHWRDMRDGSVSPCLVCHTPSDCSTCHSEHAVHQEQDLYA